MRLMKRLVCMCYIFFFQAEDGIRDYKVTGVQTCALPISRCLLTDFQPRDALCWDENSDTVRPRPRGHDSAIRISNNKAACDGARATRYRIIERNPRHSYARRESRKTHEPKPTRNPVCRLCVH